MSPIDLDSKAWVTYKAEIFLNETDSVFLTDILFISFVGPIVKFDRRFDAPIFDLKDIEKLVIKMEE